MTISSNTLILNESKNVDGLVKNLLDAEIDEIIFLDGGSDDGTYEKLLEWEKQYSQIIVIRWKQPPNTAYRKGFNEKARRTVMLTASTSDMILYIDADERISKNFKAQIPCISNFAVRLVQFWGKNIRVNTKDDKVWYPSWQFRLIMNKKNGTRDALGYSSRDPNGLHCFLSKNGKRIFSGFNRGRVFTLLCRIWNFLIGFRYKKLDFVIYHIHYLNIGQAMKMNDCRIRDLNLPVILVNTPEEGMGYVKAKDHVCCCLKDSEGLIKEVESYL